MCNKLHYSFGQAFIKNLTLRAHIWAILQFYLQCRGSSLSLLDVASSEKRLLLSLLPILFDLAIEVLVQVIHIHKHNRNVKRIPLIIQRLLYTYHSFFLLKQIIIKICVKTSKHIRYLPVWSVKVEFNYPSILNVILLCVLLVLLDMHNNITIYCSCSMNTD